MPSSRGGAGSADAREGAAPSGAPADERERARAEWTSSRTARELRVKTTWLTVFRIVASTIVLALLALRLRGRLPLEELTALDRASFGLVAFVYALTLAVGLALRLRRVGRRVAWLQIGADVTLASCLVFLSGGPESPFTFVYSLAVIAASVLLYRRGALAAAALSMVGYLAVVLLLQAGLAPSLSGWTVRPARELVVGVALPVLAQFLVAVLSGTVAEQLFVTGGRLSEREDELRSLTALQNRIVADMPSGLVTCDPQGVVTFMNPAAAAILQRGQRRPSGLHLDELLPGALALTPGRRRSELTVATPGGARTLGLTVTPLDDGRAGTLVVFQDLSDHRRLEEELRRIDRLANLGRISAQLAHEVRNPLASIRGAAQMLGAAAAPEASDARMSRLIVREADRLAGLVDDYLRLARPPPPVRRRERVDVLAAETLEALALDPLLGVVVLERELAPAEADLDAGQFRQVLINLVRNAAQAVAAQEGGRARRVRVRLWRGAGAGEGAGAWLEVWDSAGAVADKERVFEAFYSTRSDGTGLGLSTVQNIVHAHGGRVELDSTPERGTSFRVLWPLAAEA